MHNAMGQRALLQRLGLEGRPHGTMVCWPMGVADFREVARPGSLEAVCGGCRCGAVDNEHGRGYHWMPFRPVRYRIAGDCPLHASMVAQLQGLEPGAAGRHG